jgi:hypothetical protein
MRSDKDDNATREIHPHLELDTKERIADSMSAEELRDAGHRAFGNVTQIRRTPPWFRRRSGPNTQGRT